MSLITQCPACSTMFKVVPDQLRISQGWVRCGQCDEVFDANAHMYIDPADPSSAPPSESAAQETDNPSTLTQPHDGSEPASSAESSTSAVPDSPAGQAPSQVPSTMVVPEVEEVAPVGAEQVTDVASRDIEGAPSFMRTKGVHPVWGRPAVRVALVLCNVMLLLGLLLQIVLQERDRIAAYQPQLKNGLGVLCEALDCAVAPLKQIESVVIDSSSFIKVRADVFRLNVTLKNTADVELATPALELTLTDAHERTVLRRVLSPQEWGAPRAAMGVGEELVASVPVSVKFTGNAERNSGYRLIAFYP